MADPRETERRLVIVDDDLLSREVLVLLAAEVGFTVDSYESGEAALDALAAAPVRLPHAILADMQMPGICGNPLAERLRAACGSKTQLLAMSGTEVAEDSVSRFDAFLQKPFSMDEVIAVMDGAADGMPGPAHPPPAGPLEAELAATLNMATYASLAQSMTPEQVRKLYAMCLDDADSRIETLRHACAARDADEYRRAAHSIKGGCGMVGASELARMAADMEERGLPAIDDVAPFAQFLDASARLRRILDAR